MWRVQQHKSIIQKEQEDLADQMYKKHFQKYFYDWYKKFIKYRQLSIEDEKLQKFQHSKLLQKCWDVLVEHKNDSIWERSATKVADDERSHWLAKRALKGWVSQMDKLKKKNNLYKLLKSHYEYSLKKKAMVYYKNYTNFKTEQRYCDMVLVSQVVQMRQRNIIQKWHRVQVRREAMKKLSFLSERALK